MDLEEEAKRRTSRLEHDGWGSRARLILLVVVLAIKLRTSGELALL
jgi:hypothetical protein